jgi:chemotaxis response regulator CheB
VVQDPEEALFASMPEHVLEYVAVDHSVPLAKLAPPCWTACGANRRNPEAREERTKA